MIDMREEEELLDICQELERCSDDECLNQTNLGNVGKMPAEEREKYLQELRCACFSSCCC